MSAQRAPFRPAADGQNTPRALAVMGVGLVIDQHPGYALWAEIERAGGGRVALPAPAGSLRQCREQAALFRAAAWRSALTHRPADGGALEEFVESYPLPTVVAVPSTSRHADDLAGWVNAYGAELRRALRNGAGMAFHDINRIDRTWAATDNDFLWSHAFRLFDQSGDLNSLMLWAEEGYAIRTELGSWRNGRGEPLASMLAREKAPGDWSDSFAALLLGYGKAAEWLMELAPYVCDASRVTQFANGVKGRTAHCFGGLQFELARHPTAGAATAHVPAPWTRAQMAQYDQMPVLAWMHRPHVADYLDDGKKPLPAQAQVECLAAAIDAAMKAGPVGHVPQRILYDPGAGEGMARRKAVLIQAVQAALPACDLFDPRVGYDLRERLGDTGAASAVASLGLASMAAWETKAAVMVIAARRDGGACVALVTPTRAAYRDQFTRPPYEPA